MKLVDANVLLYAVNRDSDHHEASRRWLDNALSGAERVGFAWVPLLAFLRLSTRRDVFGHALDAQQATAVIADWLSASTAEIVHPTPRHVDVLSRLLTHSGAAGNLVNDAHLAALALEHRGNIVSYDTDFERLVPGRWHRPDDLIRA